MAVTQPIIIPMWLYDRMVAQDGKESTDRAMKAFKAVAVASWQDAVDLEQTKERLNRG